MRTTLSIDDDVLNAAKEMAAIQRTSAGKIISELARRALTQPADGTLIQRNGFWVLPKRGGLVTSDLVKRLAEDDR
ncbi:MAG: CopG family transcriptional regulator [Xanthobacteraceae bacterium]